MRTRPAQIRFAPLWITLVVLTAIGMVALGGCQDPTNDGLAGPDSPGIDTGGTDPGGIDPGTDPGDGGTDPGGGGGTDPGDGGGTDPGNGGGTDPGDGGGTDPGQTGTSLTGAWSGNVDYQVSTSGVPGLDKTTPVARPTDIIFDGQGKPNVVTIYLTEVPLVFVDVPTEGLVKPGDQKDVPVDGQDAGEVTVKLDSLTFADTTCRMELAITYNDPGLVSLGAVFTGPHVVTATLQDGQITWQSQTNLSTTITAPDGTAFTIKQDAAAIGVLSRK